MQIEQQPVAAVTALIEVGPVTEPSEGVPLQIQVFSWNGGQESGGPAPGERGIR